MYLGKLLPGEHSVKVDHEQYYTETKIVKIVPGYLERIFFELTPRTGSLEVITTPPRLTVILDGEKKGESPLMVQNLIIGEHLLEFDNQTFKVRLGIKISEYETVKIEIDTSKFIYPYLQQPEENKLKMKIRNIGNIEIVEQGICWSKEAGVALSNAEGMEKLNPGISEYELNTVLNPGWYYVKPYLTTLNSTIYGEEIQLLIFSCGDKFTDKRDNESYKTIQIGKQCWMGENLKTIRFADGRSILLVEKSTGWKKLSYSGKAYCNFGNSITNRNIYGGLYTWSAVMNGADSSNTNPSNVQGLCPDGWHLPSDSEWMQLEIYLGMDQVKANAEGWRGTNEGGKLKETETEHWNNPNIIATNSSGFTALPGGYRGRKGDFLSLGYYAYFWSSTEFNSDYALSRTLCYSNSEVYRSIGYKKGGFSVRCLRD